MVSRFREKLCFDFGVIYIEEIRQYYDDYEFLLCDTSCPI